MRVRPAGPPATVPRICARGCPVRRDRGRRGLHRSHPDAAARDLADKARPDRPRPALRDGHRPTWPRHAPARAERPAAFAAERPAASAAERPAASAAERPAASAAERPAASAAGTLAASAAGRPAGCAVRAAVGRHHRRRGRPGAGHRRGTRGAGEPVRRRRRSGRCRPAPPWHCADRRASRGPPRAGRPDRRPRGGPWPGAGHRPWRRWCHRCRRRTAPSRRLPPLPLAGRAVRITMVRSASLAHAPSFSAGPVIPSTLPAGAPLLKRARSLIASAAGSGTLPRTIRRSRGRRCATARSLPCSLGW
jgi:hypothetical protein